MLVEITHDDVLTSFIRRRPILFIFLT